MTNEGAPLVSVILPVHNGERFIGDTLDAALQQTHPNLEVVVVDDGSSDGTRAVVEARAARDARIRLVVQPNRGVAAARNRAVAEARGDFIAPLDADDVWEPTKIERQVRRMIEAGETTGMVYCWWMWIDPNGAVLDASPRWRIEGHVPDALLQVNYTGNASVPLFRRRCLEEIGGYDETLRDRGGEGCEDLDVALKVGERASVAVVPMALVGYRRRGDSMSSRIDQMWRSYVLVLEGVRRRRPALRPAALRRARSQFALYLAGVSFWCGSYGRAIGWGLRALPSRVTLEILPHILRLLPQMIVRRTRVVHVDTVRPGTRFAEWTLPEPLIPYDRIYHRRFARAGHEC